MLDTLDLMAAANVRHACLLGTSRGGLIAMLMAAARPAALAGVILNDIGPEIDPSGLARIISYVGKLPRPADWDEAGQIIKDASGGQFPKLAVNDWRAQARKIYRERDGRLVADYDPALAKGLAKIDLGQPLPTMWPQFDALANIPLLVIRGANSDILTADILKEMTGRHPSLQSHIVPDAGHAPLLGDEPTLKQILEFVRRLD
jgi:pimeloyl-ACP methyl ester carboxylesterase